MNKLIMAAPWSTTPSLLNFSSELTTTNYPKTRTTVFIRPNFSLEPVTSSPINDWENVNLGVPVAICIVVIILVIVTTIVAKKRRGRLRGQGRQHPSRVMSGGPAMSVEAFRRYPGTVPHSQNPQIHSQMNEVILGVGTEPAPLYPGPPELPPSYEDVIRMSGQIGTTNLGYSPSVQSLQIDPPRGSTSQPQNTTAHSSGESLHNNPGNHQNTQNEQSRNEQSISEPNNSVVNSSNTRNDSSEKQEPEICTNDNGPKLD